MTWRCCLQGLAREFALVQELIRELYADGVLGIQAFDDIDQLRHQAANSVVFLIVVPVLNVISPYDLRATIRIAYISLSFEDD
jgi:hypothetical protein